VRENVTNGDDSEGADAQAGTGAPPERRPSPAPRRKRRNAARGETDADPSMRALIRAVGKNKLVPDRTAQEIYYSRSLVIRRLIAEFLEANVGSVWTDLTELHARAANYASCSSVTAARWIRQFTSVGTRHRLLDAVDHWILEWRD